jgi:hypothetical protein
MPFKKKNKLEAPSIWPHDYSIKQKKSSRREKKSVA